MTDFLGIVILLEKKNSVNYTAQEIHASLTDM